MSLRFFFGLAVALALAPFARADDLDDLDLGAPPSAAPSAAPAKAAPVKDEVEDLLKGDAGLGEAPATLPGGFRDAWNLVSALAFMREAKLDMRPAEPPFKSWQALHVSQEVSAILAGATDLPAPLKGLIERRLEGLLGRKGDDDEVSLSVDGPPASAKAGPPAGLDEEVERLARQLAVIDRADSPRAQEAARELAQRAGDPALGPRLAAAAAHGTGLVPFTDRMRALVHQPLGVPWVTAQLASGNADAVQAALDYARNGATQAEVHGLLAAMAERRVSAEHAAPLLEALGATAGEDQLPELEKLAAAGVPGRALGECEGRIRQRADELDGWRSGSEVDRRDIAARINQAAIPLFRAGRYRDALAKFRVASELDPLEVSYRFNRGHALYRLGNVADGADLMREAVSQSRDEILMYENLLSALRDLGRRADLVSFLEERAPRVSYSAVAVLCYLNLAHEYIAAGRATEAHQALDIAFARAVPERYLTPLLTRRGDAFLLTGDVAQARRAYQEALNGAPENRRALDGILRVDAWQPELAGTAPAAGPVAAGPAGASSALPAEAADADGLDLDGPAPKSSPAAPVAPVPAPKPSPAAKDDLDLDI